jgi:hypothetical protein
MNNITNELFKQFVQSLLDDECGVNEEAYELLNEIMKNDKNLASVLHDTIEMCDTNSDGRYVINPY